VWVAAEVEGDAGVIEATADAGETMEVTAADTAIGVNERETGAIACSDAARHSRSSTQH